MDKDVTINILKVVTNSISNTVDLFLGTNGKIAK